MDNDSSGNKCEVQSTTSNSIKISPWLRDIEILGTSEKKRHEDIGTLRTPGAFQTEKEKWKKISDSIVPKTP